MPKPPARTNTSDELLDPLDELPFCIACKLSSADVVEFGDGMVARESRGIDTSTEGNTPRINERFYIRYCLVMLQPTLGEAVAWGDGYKNEATINSLEGC